VIVLDSSGLIALVTRRDTHHLEARSIIRAGYGQLVVPAGIMSEVAYLLEHRGGVRSVDAVLQSIEDGSLRLDCGEQDVPRIRQLVTRYQDLALGFADASVIACGERLHAPILTFDLRHFPVVAREGTFRIASENGP